MEASEVKKFFRVLKTAFAFPKNVVDRLACVAALLDAENEAALLGQLPQDFSQVERSEVFVRLKSVWTTLKGIASDSHKEDACDVLEKAKVELMHAAEEPFCFTPEMLRSLDDITYDNNYDEHELVNIIYRLKQGALGVLEVFGDTPNNTPVTLIPFACKLLTARWNAIKDTLRDYTYCTYETNQSYVIFTKELYAFALDMEKCSAISTTDLSDWMRPLPRSDRTVEANYYALLIPTLTQIIEPVSQRAIIDIKLDHNFIVSQDGQSLISLKNSQDSFDRGEGFFNVDVFPIRFFTSTEKARIKNKPWKLRPQVTFELIDYILTDICDAPALKNTTVVALTRMVNGVLALKQAMPSMVASNEKKYCEENKPFEAQDKVFLWELRAAELHEEHRRVKESSQSDEQHKPEETTNLQVEENAFKRELDGLDVDKKKEYCTFLAYQACKRDIANIATEMLTYCQCLKGCGPDEYNRLMNQVFFDGKTTPKTFYSLMLSVMGSQNVEEVGNAACADLTFSDLSELLKCVTCRVDEAGDKPVAKALPMSMSPSQVLRQQGFYRAHQNQDARSVTMALSPDEDNRTTYLSGFGTA